MHTLDPNREKVRRSAERLAKKNPTSARIVERATGSYRAAWFTAQVDFVFFCLIAMSARCAMEEAKHIFEACHFELRSLKNDLRITGYPLQSICSLRQNHVDALVRLWNSRGLDRARVSARCNALNVLLKAVDKYAVVRAKSPAA